MASEKRKYCNVCKSYACSTATVKPNSVKSKDEEKEVRLNIDHRLKWFEKSERYKPGSEQSKLLQKFTEIDSQSKLVFKHSCAYKGCNTKPTISKNQLNGDIYFCAEHRKHLATQLEKKMIRLLKGKTPVSNWIETLLHKLKTFSDEQILKESMGTVSDKNISLDNYYPKMLTEIECHKVTILKSIGNYKANAPEYWLMRQRLTQLTSAAKLLTIIRKIFNPFWMVSAAIDSFGDIATIDYDIVCNIKDKKLKRFTDADLKSMQAMSSVMGECLKGDHIEKDCKEIDTKLNKVISEHADFTTKVNNVSNHIKLMTKDISNLTDEQTKLQKEVDAMIENPISMMDNMDKYAEMENKLLEIQGKKQQFELNKTAHQSALGEFKNKLAEIEEKKKEIEREKKAHQQKLNALNGNETDKTYNNLQKRKFDGGYTLYINESDGQWTSDKGEISFNGNKFSGKLLYDNHNEYSPFEGQINEQLECTFKLKYYGSWYDYKCSFTGDSFVGLWKHSGATHFNQNHTVIWKVVKK